MHKGYIKLYRKLQEKSWWSSQRFTWGQAWVDLLLRANHKDAQIVIDYKPYKVLRGSFITSQRQLAKDWKWGIGSVSRFVSYLQKTEQSIERTTERRFTHIFILNWGKYQGEWNTKRNEVWNDSGTIVETNKNDKNGKEAVEEAKEEYTAAYSLVAYWQVRVKTLKGYEPLSEEKDVQGADRFLKDHSLEEAKNFVDWYLDSELSAKMGAFRTMFQPWIINNWLSYKSNQKQEYADF